MYDVLAASQTPAAAAKKTARDDVGASAFKDFFTTLTKAMEKSRHPAAANTRPADAPGEENSAPAGMQNSSSAPLSERPAEFRAADTERDDEDLSVEAISELAAAMQPLTPTQQEILERLTVLAADNGLDPQMLAELDENALTELADWVLAGAGGLLPEAAALAADMPDADAQPVPADTEAAAASLPQFGLAGQSVALLQFDAIMQRADAVPVRETALLGELVNLSELSTIDIDRLAQAVLNAVGANAESGSADLRALLKTTDSDALRAAMETALKTINGAAAELPEMPEVVLKSLAVEIVNVNNAELDAADQRLALLNGLDNNAQLRADILQQLRTADAAALSGAVNAEKFNETLNNSPIIAEIFSEGTEFADFIPDNAETFSAEENSAGKMNIPLTADNDAVSDSMTFTNPKNTASADAVQLAAAEKVLTANDADAVKDGKTAAAKMAPDAVNNAENFENSDTVPETPKHAKKSEAAAPLREAPVSDTLRENAAINDDAEGMLAENQPLTARTHDNPLNFDYGTDNSTAPTRQAELQENINRLTEMIEQAAKSDSRTLKSLTLALNPPELGEVKIEIEMSKNGGVTATVKVENDGARNLMLSGLDQLRKNLESQGVSLEQFNVELGGKDAGQQQSHNTGGEWFGAQSDERGRRAREAANRLPGLNTNASDAETEIESAPVMRHIDGNSFELIA